MSNSTFSKHTSPKQVEKNIKKKPRKVSYDRLRNGALYYLGRYASSSENLRQVLKRRVQKSAFHHKDTDMEQAYIWIDDIISDMQRLGYIDDTEYTNTKVGSMHRRGTSSRTIRQKLKQKGLSDDIITNALEMLEETQPNAELAAAIRYAKRRRIGIYRIKDVTDPDKQYQRDLASLARNGFTLDICYTIMDADDIETLETMLENL